MSCRVLALVLAAVLLLTLATPAQAEANPMLIIGAIGAAVVVIVLVAYLVVANVEGPRRADRDLDQGPDRGSDRDADRDQIVLVAAVTDEGP